MEKQTRDLPGDGEIGHVHLRLTGGRDWGSRLERGKLKVE